MKWDKLLAGIFILVLVLCGCSDRQEEKNEVKMEEEISDGETMAETQEEADYVDEEKLFLQEHLYGQWCFSERLIEIDEDNNIYYGAKPNISDVGVEELKKSVRLAYDERYVLFTVKIGQNSFTYAQDMYLFAAHGGFCWCRNPIYYLKAMEEDVITLRDVYNMSGYEVSVPDMDKYIHVTYSPMSDPNNSEVYGNIFTCFGSDIYIDPNDKDTIYIDFCGLWKMERDDNYYGTDGKSEF